MKQTLFEETRIIFWENTPFFEILGPRILPQIYPFLSEIMDERGVMFSLTLHPPGPNCCCKKVDTNPLFSRPFLLASALSLVIAIKYTITSSLRRKLTFIRTGDMNE